MAAEFNIGDAVIIHGLPEPSMLNGYRGVVHDLRATDGRYTYRVVPNADNIILPRGAEPLDLPSVGVHEENLSLDYPVGSGVVIRDLVEAGHLNGTSCKVVGFEKRRCRFVVEISSSDTDDDVGNSAAASTGTGNASSSNAIGDGEHGDGITVRTSATDGSKKKMSIKPINVTFLPGRRPKPLPVLEQRLIFRGPMRGVARLLHHSAYRTGSPIFGDMARLQSSGEEMNRSGMAGTVWRKIRPFERRTSSDEEDESPSGRPCFPPHRRELVKLPSCALTRKICFNPSCHRFISSGTGETMKRCKKCKSVCYCNKECALADWSLHKMACRSLEKEGVPLADYVTLSSPHRDMAVRSQRMVRHCVRAVASLDNPEQHLAQQQPSSGTAATLLYRVLTEAGGDVANQVLLHLDSPPVPGEEAAVCIGFNSLGQNPVFDEADVRKLAYIYECNVEHRVKDDDIEGEEDSWKRHLSADPCDGMSEHGAPTTGGTPGPDGLGMFLNNLGNMGGDGSWQIMDAGVAGPVGFPMPLPPGFPPGPFPMPPNMNGVAFGPFPMPPGGMAQGMNEMPNMGGVNDE